MVLQRSLLQPFGALSIRIAPTPGTGAGLPQAASGGAQDLHMQEGTNHGPDAIWSLLAKIGTTMLVTRTGESFDARPMQAYPDPAAHEIAFMTDSQRVISEVNSNGRVLLAFTDKTNNNYVSLTGKAVVSDDRDRIARLWSAWALAYWKSAHDPDIRLIIVTPEQARYWDSPGAVVSTVAMLAGALYGKKPKLGTSGEVEI